MLCFVFVVCSASNDVWTVAVLKLLSGDQPLLASVEKRESDSLTICQHRDFDVSVENDGDLISALAFIGISAQLSDRAL